MPNSTITVQHTDGSAARGGKVSIAFQGLLGTIPESSVTDSNGIAVISHQGAGKADIHVNGQKSGEFRAPGSKTVCL